MIKLLSMCILLSASVFSFQNEDVYVGDWEGKLVLPQGGELRVLFHITKGEDGKLAAKLDSPDQNVIGADFTSATADKEGILKLELTQAQASFTGKIEDGKLKGTWKQGPGELPLEMTRKGE